MFHKYKSEIFSIFCLAAMRSLLGGGVQTQPERPRIAVLSMAIGEQYQNAVECGLQNKKEFCNLHGYDFLCLDHLLDASRPFSWNKIPWIQQSLSNYDWVMWSDADSLIMNMNVKIESLIDESFDFIIAQDNVSNCVNAGQFFIRNSQSSHEFLQTVWAMEQYILHPWWEQQAIIEALKMESYRNGFCKILPQKTFNSFAPELGFGPLATYSKGDFIIHFPSIRNLDQLKRLMEGYASGRLPKDPTRGQSGQPALPGRPRYQHAAQGRSQKG